MLVITPADAIAALNILTGRLHTVATGSPILEVYSGDRPVNAAQALTDQVLLVTLILDETAAFKPAADDPAKAYVEALNNPIPDAMAEATATATWFRILDDAGDVRWIGDVTEPNLGGDLELSSINIVDNVNVVVVTLRAQFPKTSE